MRARCILSDPERRLGCEIFERSSAISGLRALGVDHEDADFVYDVEQTEFLLGFVMAT